MRTQHAGASGGSLSDVIVADCLISDAVGDAVYISGDKVSERFQVTKVDIDDGDKMPAVGIIIRKNTSTECVVQCGGVLYSFSTGLTPQSILFVQENSALALGPPSRPNSGLRWVQPMAYAFSSEDIRIAPGQPVKIRPA